MSDKKLLVGAVRHFREGFQALDKYLCSFVEGAASPEADKTETPAPAKKATKKAGTKKAAAKKEAPKANVVDGFNFDTMDASEFKAMCLTFKETIGKEGILEAFSKHGYSKAADVDAVEYLDVYKTLTAAASTDSDDDL